MTLRIIVFFVVSVSICTCTQVRIEDQVLHDVFGYAPQASIPLAADSQFQASAVTPVTENESTTEAQYYEWDYYNPPDINYDLFDWTLTKRVASSSDENFLLSPLGLKLALAILTEAATGVTKNELLIVLGFSSDQSTVRQKFTSIIDSLKKESPQYILNVGSRVYVGSNVRPKQMFAAIAEEFYKTELKTVDFHHPPEAAMQINAWVSNITKGKISHLVSEDDVANVAVMVLNALYFKGSWRHQFAPNETKYHQFYITPTVTKDIPFMNVNNKFYYTESAKLRAKILRMPYLGNKFSMYIIVPNDLSGMPHVMSNINVLRTEMNNLREHYVDITLPKFKFDYTSQLGGILKELGIRDAFEDTASFPGIARGQYLSERIKISKVLQRSGIEVNELGSVAYAATEIALENKFGEETESQVEVVANRPFLFFIQDELTRQLLVTGRVSDPTLLDGAFKLV
uniref:Serpin n=1 Tax=Hyphantria cunea TaxID=39466 RepID=O96358_HYPCU|nr:putative serpin [Hyphantria cunea]AAD40672.1 serpin [Hyphantria cunea]